MFYIDLDKGPCQKDCPWRRMSCLHFQNSRNMAVKHPKLNTAAAIWWRLCAPRGASQVTAAFLYAKLNELHPWRCHYLISEAVTSTLQLGSSVTQLCSHCWSWCFQSTMSCTCLPRISSVLVRWCGTRWRISMKLTFYKQPQSAAARIQRWVLWVLWWSGPLIVKSKSQQCPI